MILQKLMSPGFEEFQLISKSAVWFSLNLIWPANTFLNTDTYCIFIDETSYVSLRLVTFPIFMRIGGINLMSHLVLNNVKTQGTDNSLVLQLLHNAVACFTHSTECPVKSTIVPKYVDNVVIERR